MTIFWWIPAHPCNQYWLGEKWSTTHHITLPLGFLPASTASSYSHKSQQLLNRAPVQAGRQASKAGRPATCALPLPLPPVDACMPRARTNGRAKLASTVYCSRLPLLCSPVHACIITPKLHSSPRFVPPHHPPHHARLLRLRVRVLEKRRCVRHFPN